ncbi:hypothetical protein SAMN04489717_5548 [Actinopolymorpha singaporensis]|uniref:Uncharacterized protein n=1 Tax=Actinopolymorpha singaporensis TaxID=117157 RepID=A0A1H1YKP3_9ACTN|nr:hypothetical protein SAMN04489717_5548 [Actinopolymorpha singaporensis]
MHPIMIEAVAQAHRDDLLRAGAARRRASRVERRPHFGLAGLSGLTRTAGVLLRGAAPRRPATAPQKSSVLCCA